MGHIRLGQLPRTVKWVTVAGAIAGPDTPVHDVARAIAEAADDHLQQLGRDPSIAYLYWLLTRVTRLAREPDYVAALRAQGVKLRSEPEGLRLLAAICDFARAGLRARGASSGASELAFAAFQATLTRFVMERADTLFGTTSEDIQRALRTLSTPDQFGHLAREYFGSFLSSVFQFVASKETSLHVGPRQRFRDPADAAAFERDLGVYAHQTTLLLRDFAAEWYSKHNWIGDLDEAQARRFVSYAWRKVRTELQREAATR